MRLCWAAVLVSCLALAGAGTLAPSDLQWSQQVLSPEAESEWEAAASEADDGEVEADASLLEGVPPQPVEQLYQLGFMDDYRCTGRVYDEPRRWRLKCSHNPRRAMGCRCQPKGGSSRLVHCDCSDPAINLMGDSAPLYALDKPEEIVAAVLPEPHLVAVNRQPSSS